eukprot:TRINITY_DN74872_c0_g1_i1.p1 TRINITY_DN74872_c0_g1~~TRINITY_DN74872_c0_g1_i1.p1  ORF type:complete len:304 (-),score=35.65 TRINITY_DN74872_c0_g1_i1:230-1141(-)
MKAPVAVAVAVVAAISAAAAAEEGGCGAAAWPIDVGVGAPPSAEFCAPSAPSSEPRGRGGSFANVSAVVVSAHEPARSGAAWSGSERDFLAFFAVLVASGVVVACMCAWNGHVGRSARSPREFGHHRQFLFAASALRRSAALIGVTNDRNDIVDRSAEYPKRQYMACWHPHGLYVMAPLLFMSSGPRNSSYLSYGFFTLVAGACFRSSISCLDKASRYSSTQAAFTNSLPRTRSRNASSSHQTLASFATLSGTGCPWCRRTTSAKTSCTTCQIGLAQSRAGSTDASESVCLWASAVGACHFCP